MEEICNVCGLPKNICVCTQITKEAQKIKVRVMKRTFGKMITTISGIDNAETAKQLEKAMKHKLACGGTTKGTAIELQGNHKKKVREILIEQGYKGDSIDDS